jgi:hypothetical protein
VMCTPHHQPQAALQGPAWCGLQNRGAEVVEADNAGTGCGSRGRCWRRSGCRRQVGVGAGWVSASASASASE